MKNTENKILAIKETPCGVVELHRANDEFIVIESLDLEEYKGTAKYCFATQNKAEEELNNIVRRHMNI
jgi:hypothetical protein